MVESDSRNNFMQKNQAAYDRFLKVRDILDPHFCEHQEKAAKRITESIMKLSRSSPAVKIDHIISLGCGSGEIECGIFSEINEIRESTGEGVNGTHCVNIWGFDCSSVSRSNFENNIRNLYYEQSQYRNIVERIRGCTPPLVKNFFSISDSLDLLKKKIKKYNEGCKNSSAIPVAHENTLLLLAGHTLTHFQEYEMWFESNTDKDNFFPPKYIFFDLYYTWDDVLSGLKDNNEMVVEWRGTCQFYPPQSGGPVSPEEACMFGLGTKVVDGNTVDRGIWVKSLSSGCCANCKLLSIDSPDQAIGENKEWFFVKTRQHMQKSSDIIEVFTQKKNTEQPYFPYIVYESFSYQTGYGPMDGWLMVAPDRESEIANQAFSDAVRSIVLPATLGDDKDEKKWFADEIVDSLNPYGKFLLGVIEPFDSLLNYSFYVPANMKHPYFFKNECGQITVVSKGCKNGHVRNERNGHNDAHRHRMLISPFNPDHEQYPSADGLYYCLLADPGSGLIVPPVMLPEKESYMVEIDRELWALEENLICCNQHILSGAKSGSELDADSCCRKNTDGENGVKSDSNNTDIEKMSFLCVPFFYGSLPLFYLLLQHIPNINLFTERRELIEEMVRRVLRTIRKRFDGDQQNLFLRELVSNFIAGMKGNVLDEKKIKERMKKLFVTARGKRWKNWLDFFPEISISKVSKIKKEDQRIDALLEEAIETMTRNPREVMSLIFEKHNFFEGKNHDKFTSDHGRKWKDIEKEAVSLDFVKNHQGFKWLQQKIPKGSDNAEITERKFNLIKAYYCRAAGNTSSSYRFYILELFTLVEIYFDCSTIKQYKIETCFREFDEKEHKIEYSNGEPVSFILEKIFKRLLTFCQNSSTSTIQKIPCKFFRICSGRCKGVIDEGKIEVNFCLSDEINNTRGSGDESREFSELLGVTTSDIPRKYKSFLIYWEMKKDGRHEDWSAEIS